MSDPISVDCERPWLVALPEALLLERGNFARDVLFPDFNFVPPDIVNDDEDIRGVAERIRLGMDITSATQPPSANGESAGAPLPPGPTHVRAK